MNLIRSVSDLVQALDRGERVKYLLFWGHQPGREGAVDKACLSQWYPASFEVDDTMYPSAEHFMMAEKARLFGDTEAIGRILDASHPGAAKRIGREVRGYNETAWSAVRVDAVVRGNVAKFGQNAALAAFLLGTGERVLVEASPVDAVWGIGLAAGDGRAQNPSQWQGDNLLGFALMEARHRLS
ncbi:MAG: NADAR family protein [Bacteroidota bacterium]